MDITKRLGLSKFAKEAVGFRGNSLAPSPWILFENFFQGIYLDPFGQLPSKGQLRGCNRAVMPKRQSPNLTILTVSNA